MSRRRFSGFTLVELIIVIILLAIVSLYAASRYLGRDTFAAFVVQEQVVSVIRQVQVNRMQSNVSDLTGNTNFTLTVQPDCIGSLNGCLTRDDRRSDWVSVDGVSFTPTRSRLDFDMLGEPEASIQITVRSSTDQCIVTIEQNGYVSQGGCS